MKLSVALNECAQAYAEELARIDNMQHAKNLQQLGQGENLAYCWSSDGASADYAWATQQDRIPTVLCIFCAYTGLP